MSSHTTLVCSDVPDATPSRHRHTELALSVSLALAACYMLVLPSGRLGALWALTSLAVALSACNRATLTAYLLLFGGATFGSLAMVIGLAGFGGKITGLLGLLLAITDRGFLRMVARLQQSLLWIGWFGLVLIAWYCFGPRTEYCQDLVVRYFMAAPTATIGFAYLFWKPSLDWRALGQVTLVSALVLLVCGGAVEPSLLPAHPLDIAVFREARSKLPDDVSLPVGAGDLAHLAAMGAILMACATPDRKLGRRDRTRLIASLIMASVVLGWAFNRLRLVAFVAAFAVMPFTRPRFRSRYTAIALLSALLLGGVVVVAFMNESGFVMRVLESGQSVDERLNRSTNWQASYYCIRQKPWLGHGLGGYYIPGRSYSGEGLYSHNLLLQLLSELGVLGAGVGFAPLMFLWRKARGNFSATLRAASGAIVLPALVPACLAAMGTGSLAGHSAVFALIAVLVARWPESLLLRRTPMPRSHH